MAGHGIIVFDKIKLKNNQQQKNNTWSFESKLCSGIMVRWSLNQSVRFVVIDRDLHNA